MVNEVKMCGFIFLWWMIFVLCGKIFLNSECVVNLSDGIVVF